jgi:hypothetical protein
MVNLLFAAGFCLVAAQIVGIYALWTRKADLVFAIVMAVLLAGAAIFGGLDLYHRLH